MSDVPKNILNTAKIADIMKALPHRYPFLLVDRVLEITRNPPDALDHVGEKISALKNVSINEPFFQGHFPDLPIMPGVLIVEAMAQASALLAIRERPDGTQWSFMILGIDNARFRLPVVPGDTVKFTCEVLKDRKSIFVFACQAHVDEQLVCEAEILARMY